MKISFKRTTFANAFKAAASVTAKRDVKPILMNVKIRADKKTGVLLQATDTEMGIRLNVADCNVFDEGEALLPTNRIKSILTDCRDNTLTLESTESEITVSGERDKWLMDALPPDELPDVKKFTAKAYHEIPAKILKEMIRRTVFAADKDNVRYALAGVSFEMIGSTVSVVATNGKQLAWQQGSGKSVKGHEVETAIVPAKALQLLEKALPDDDTAVQFAISQNLGLFQSGSVTFFSRLVEGHFPKWRKVIPVQNGNTSIEMLAGDLFSAIKRVAVTIPKWKPGVFFIFGDGKLELRGGNKSIGESSTEVPIVYNGEKKEFKIDSKCMTDMLRVIDSKTVVKLYPPQDDTPFVLAIDDGFTFVVQPMLDD
ncbi:DNA polymerase III subunit beta [Planctomycetales bacterium]|nr:DNA polymerase III subunit beta [Planctomycetales bacterium]